MRSGPIKLNDILTKHFCTDDGNDIHPVDGTVDRIYRNGEDTVYCIKYNDGDSEEMAYDDVQLHIQLYKDMSNHDRKRDGNVDILKPFDVDDVAYYFCKNNETPTSIVTKLKNRIEGISIEDIISNHFNISWYGDMKPSSLLKRGTMLQIYTHHEGNDSADDDEDIQSDTETLGGQNSPHNFDERDQQTNSAKEDLGINADEEPLKILKHLDLNPMHRFIPCEGTIIEHVPNNQNNQDTRGGYRVTFDEYEMEETLNHEELQCGIDLYNKWHKHNISRDRMLPVPLVGVAYYFSERDVSLKLIAEKLCCPEEEIIQNSFNKMTFGVGICADTIVDAQQPVQVCCDVDGLCSRVFGGHCNLNNSLSAYEESYENEQPVSNKVNDDDALERQMFATKQPKEKTRVTLLKHFFDVNGFFRPYKGSCYLDTAKQLDDKFFFSVKYEDGDTEDMDEMELHKCVNFYKAVRKKRNRGKLIYFDDRHAYYVTKRNDIPNKIADALGCKVNDIIMNPVNIGWSCKSIELGPDTKLPRSKMIHVNPRWLDNEKITSHSITVTINAMKENNVKEIDPNQKPFSDMSWAEKVQGLENVLRINKNTGDSLQQRVLVLLDKVGMASNRWSNIVQCIEEIEKEVFLHKITSPPNKATLESPKQLQRRSALQNKVLPASPKTVLLQNVGSSRSSSSINQSIGAVRRSLDSREHSPMNWTNQQNGRKNDKCGTKRKLLLTSSCVPRRLLLSKTKEQHPHENYEQMESSRQAQKGFLDRYNRNQQQRGTKSTQKSKNKTDCSQERESLGLKGSRYCRLCYFNFRQKNPNMAAPMIKKMCKKSSKGCTVCQETICENCWDGYKHDPQNRGNRKTGGSKRNNACSRKRESFGLKGSRCCRTCYYKLREQYPSDIAAKKSMKSSSGCKVCRETICESCWDSYKHDPQKRPKRKTHHDCSHERESLGLKGGYHCRLCKCKRSLKGCIVCREPICESCWDSYKHDPKNRAS